MCCLRQTQHPTSIWSCVSTDAQTIAILIYLLPGLAGYWSYWLVVEATRDGLDLFERLSAVVTLSVFCTAVARFLQTFTKLDLLSSAVQKGTVTTLLDNDALQTLFRLAMIGVVTGAAAGAATNRGWISGLLRTLRLTTKTEGSNVWQTAFRANGSNCWIRVRFEDGNVLSGWAKHYTLKDDNPQLLIADAIWIQADGTEKPVPEQSEVLLVSFDKVKGIEFT